MEIKMWGKKKKEIKRCPDGPIVFFKTKFFSKASLI